MIKSLIVLMVLNIYLFAQERIEIGQHAFIGIVENNMQYLARIDSGARITSLHAFNIKLEGPKALIPAVSPTKLTGYPFKKKVKNEQYRRHLGRMISFDTVNERGEVRHMKTRVVNVTRVRNAQGVEYRYVIRLGIKYGELVKFKEVNLRDRDHMTYKLLIGRNWLDNDFVIKTDLDLIKK